RAPECRRYESVQPLGHLSFASENVVHLRSGGPRPDPLPTLSWRPRRRTALLLYAARFGSLTPASAASWLASVGFSFMSRICSVRLRVSALNGFTRADPEPALPFVAPDPRLPLAGRNGAASSLRLHAST